MLLSIPVDPDADEARRLAQEELSKEIYRGGGSDWLKRFLEWLQKQFESEPNAPGTIQLGNLSVSWLIAVLFFLALGAGIVALIVIARRGRRAPSESHQVFEDDDRDAETMRRAAADAAAAGDWTLASIERFRAIVRRVEDAGWVSVVPGMTAYEFATAACTPLPSYADEFTWAGDRFDAIRYGHETGSAETYARLTTLDTALQSAKAAQVTA